MGHCERHFAGRFLGQAERPSRRPSRILEAHSVRGLRQEDRRRSHREPSLGEKHRYLRDLRRRRRLLRLRLCAAARFLRRRHAHPDDRRFTFSQGGHITHSYTDHVSTLKFIEANWGLSPITTPQPGQPAEPGHHDEPLRADQSAGDRRPDGHVQLRPAHP